MKSRDPNWPTMPAAILDDPRTLKSIAKMAPVSYAKFFGRKYILPRYREKDYFSLDYANLVSFDHCMSLAWEPEAMDDVIRCATANDFAALRYNRPTLYLERELGEALLRTPVLADLSTGDINWKWPAFKIVLPKGLLAIKRVYEKVAPDPDYTALYNKLGLAAPPFVPDGSEETRTLTHFDVCHVGPENPIKAPADIAEEMKRLIPWLSKGHPAHDITRFDFLYKTPGLCISTALDRPEQAPYGQTAYGLVKPWGEIRVADFRAVTGDLATPFPQDDVDRGLLVRLEHLVLNVLLFLSASPLWYEPEEREQVLRKPRREGERIIPGLVAARFVGKSQLKPIREEGKTIGSTGRTVAGHWVCGAWRRVAYGPKASLRRLQWIEPYRTLDPEERDGRNG